VCAKSVVWFSKYWVSGVTTGNQRTGCTLLHIFLDVIYQLINYTFFFFFFACLPIAHVPPDLQQGAQRAVPTMAENQQPGRQGRAQRQHRGGDLHQDSSSGADTDMLPEPRLAGDEAEVFEQMRQRAEAAVLQEGQGARGGRGGRRGGPISAAYARRKAAPPGGYRRAQRKAKPLRLDDCCRGKFHGECLQQLSQVDLLAERERYNSLTTDVERTNFIIAALRRAAPLPLVLLVAVLAATVKYVCSRKPNWAKPGEGSP
jgi:hypothetical protein